MVAVNIYNYVFGDDFSGGMQMHSVKWYIGKDLETVFRDIIDQEHIAQTAGNLRLRLIEAYENGTLNSEKEDELNKEFLKVDNFFTFYVRNILKNPVPISQLKGVCIYGKDGRVFYKIADAVDDDSKIEEIETSNQPFFKHKEASIDDFKNMQFF